MPRNPTLPGLANDGRARCYIFEVDDEAAVSRTISGEIRAFTGPDLRRTLDDVLCSISKAAALSEAVLEVRAVHLASPAVTPAAVLETLARDLQDAGFPARFGRSWFPVPDAEAAVGTGGAEPDFVEFLRGHPSWEIIA